MAACCTSRKFVCSLVHIFLMAPLLTTNVNSVAVTDVLLQSDSKKKDYVLYGEGATLTCKYLLEHEETLISVEWMKDDKFRVYLWQKEGPAQASGVFKDRVDVSLSTSTTVVLTKAHIDMHGSYKCFVKTDKRVADSDPVQLTVIAGGCREENFKTHSNMIECTERISLYCSGMFPKPSPACGVHNDLTGTYLTSVPFDNPPRQLKNNTYEVSLNREFSVHEWINYTDISFRCQVLVEGTTWSSGIQHKLFGDQGCLQDPPSIQNGYYLMGVNGLTCWGSPRENTRVLYRCNKSFRLVGSSELVCKNRTWVPKHVLPGTVPAHNMPECVSIAASIFSSTCHLPVILVLLLSLWLKTNTTMFS